MTPEESDSSQSPRLERYERLARELAAAYSRGDMNAIRELNWSYGTSFVWEREPEAMQRRLPTWFASEARTEDLAVADAQRMVAHSYGLESWAEFAESVLQPPRDSRSPPNFTNSTAPFYQIDWRDNRLSVRGPLSERDWDVIAGVMEDAQIAKLSAGGMTDAGMKRISELAHITHLRVGDSKELTDEGARHLARMPELVELELGGWVSPITDRALEALRHLPKLSRFKSCRTKHLTDAGVAHLAGCDRLESVDLMGAPVGDGLLRALAGKPHLRQLKTGRNVTDQGLALLHEFPIFKTWRGGETRYELMSADAEPNHLLLDGPITDAGLASLAGLDGLFGLSFFWHCPAFTAAGLEPLRNLPRLGFLGCQGEHCDDEAMRHIAAMPGLRMLMGQGAVAGDDGFVALSGSQTIEYIWGRECPNLGGKGFAALAEMPALKGLAVSCKHVDEASLATLPQFRALRGLMPMDVSDEGFGYIGQCENLESLRCMYCRETGDAATEHIAGLPLKSYYAGMTKITDRSLEILGRMASLERLEFWQCAGLTNAGVAHLAALPQLREISLDGLPGVSRKAVELFPAHVRVQCA